MAKNAAAKKSATDKKKSKNTVAGLAVENNELAVPRTPVLLRHFQVNSFLEAPTDADLASRHRVIAHLIQKIISLNSSIAVLDAQLATITDPPTYTAITLELVEARSERDLCQARSQAINASQPFQDPGPEAEAALAAAISIVDQTASNTAAIDGLIAALHGLVASYGASAT